MLKTVLASPLTRWLLLGLGLLLGLAGLIQLLPIGPLQTNPPARAEPAWPSAEVRALAVRACYDCHSNETVWPAYSRVAPISWLVTRDVLAGRSRLNFSEWGGGAGRPGGEAAEQVAEGEMPPALYVLIHPAAELTRAERQQLTDGLRQMFGGE